MKEFKIYLNFSWDCVLECQQETDGPLQEFNQRELISRHIGIQELSTAGSHYHSQSWGQEEKWYYQKLLRVWSRKRTQPQHEMHLTRISHHSNQRRSQRIRKSNDAIPGGQAFKVQSREGNKLDGEKSMLGTQKSKYGKFTNSFTFSGGSGSLFYYLMHKK